MVMNDSKENSSRFCFPCCRSLPLLLFLRPPEELRLYGCFPRRRPLALLLFLRPPEILRLCFPLPSSSFERHRSRTERGGVSSSTTRASKSSKFFRRFWIGGFGDVSVSSSTIVSNKTLVDVAAVLFVVIFIFEILVTVLIVASVVPFIFVGGVRL